MAGIDLEDGLIAVLHFDQLIPIDFLIVYLEVDEELLHSCHSLVDVDVGAVEGAALLFLHLIHHLALHLPGRLGEGCELGVEGA